jgi:hypothetical protein
MFFQAITGINSVILYSTTIFKIAGFESSLLATSLVGLTNVKTRVKEISSVLLFHF